MVENGVSRAMQARGDTTQKHEAKKKKNGNSAFCFSKLEGGVGTYSYSKKPSDSRQISNNQMAFSVLIFQILF